MIFQARCDEENGTYDEKYPTRDLILEFRPDLTFVVFFHRNSIHKPPASIRFAPIKHARAVTVEPFLNSHRQAGGL